MPCLASLRTYHLALSNFILASFWASFSISSVRIVGATGCCLLDIWFVRIGQLRFICLLPRILSQMSRRIYDCGKRSAIILLMNLEDQPIYSVSALNVYIRQMFDMVYRMQDLWIE